MTLDFKFHHFGLACASEEGALKILPCMGYSLGEKVHDIHQGVFLRLCINPLMPSLELITPATEASPINPFLRKNGELIYHTCLEVESVERFESSLRSLGIDFFCLSKPKPAILFGGNLVSFYKISGFGLVELLESPRNL